MYPEQIPPNPLNPLDLPYYTSSTSTSQSRISGTGPDFLALDKVFRHYTGTCRTRPDLENQTEPNENYNLEIKLFDPSLNLLNALNILDPMIRLDS